jgi:hypothetical protein
MSHLDTVNARWKYDIMWAAGIYSTFDLFFAAIDEKTREVRSPMLVTLVSVRTKMGGHVVQTTKRWTRDRTC